ncbi:MAG: M48 family metalloprotease [Thermodesulfobacteriota bacterium]
MFSNIIYLIIVIVLFQLNVPVEGLIISPVASFLSLILLWLGFALVCRYAFLRMFSISTRGGTRLDQGIVSSAYQRLLTRLSILSIIFFAISLYLLNLKYWLLKLPGFSALSILPSLAGIAVFFVFLSTAWYFGYDYYRNIFRSPITRWEYISSQLKLNVPILFPWALITLCYDILSLLSWPGLRKIYESATGQLVFFTLFLVVLVIFLPLLIQYFWGCSPLPVSEKRREIEDFFRSQDFRYRKILRWPLLEGRMMTAGVMGLIPRFRYILITDSLLELLSIDELKAVMAHEMGHIRYKHLLFYIFFVLGYMVISFGLFDVSFSLMALQPWLYKLLSSRNEIHVSLFYLLFSVPMILSIVIYFRYIMGFFMRNFERQADFYSVKLIGEAAPTILSLEKIATTSGIDRHQPSWHHFSIAERVESLWKASQDPQLINRHSRRVAVWLIIVFTLTASFGLALNVGPLKAGLEEKALTHLLNRRLAESPKNADIYRALSQLYHQRENLAKAAWAYENIIRLEPNDGMALNNLAWILATAEQSDLRDYPRALQLAKRAVAAEASPTFLDTLAEAYYVNGQYKEALAAINEALEKATENKQYLEEQREKFRKAGKAERRQQ